jgi:hypothetical protein
LSGIRTTKRRTLLPHIIAHLKCKRLQVFFYGGGQYGLPFKPHAIFAHYGQLRPAKAGELSSGTFLPFALQMGIGAHRNLPAYIGFLT